MGVLKSGKKKTYVSFDGFGVDVALIRKDDLDKKILTHLQRKEKPKVLDLGSGAGGQSLRMCLTGAEVWSVDKYDFSIEYKKLRLANDIDDNLLRFIKGDIRDLPKLILSENFSDILFQRTLHYLSYKEARQLLEFLRKITADRLFISVTGMESAVGEGYVGKETLVENRLTSLSPLKANIFQIKEPVCLYKKSEFVELLKISGWEIDEVWSSAFLNHKAICRVR